MQPLRYWFDKIIKTKEEYIISTNENYFLMALIIIAIIPGTIKNIQQKTTAQTRQLDREELEILAGCRTTLGVYVGVYVRVWDEESSLVTSLAIGSK